MSASDDKAFLDGLAGRAGSAGPDAAEGQRLRSALLADDMSGPQSPRPDWDAVLDASAANQSRYRPSLWGSALAAGLAVCAILSFWWNTYPEDGRLRGTPGAASATWRSPQPLEDANQLAADLRALGAAADLAIAPDGSVSISIQAAAATADAVNGRLASLETALDRQGRLQLVVIAR